jgi:osmotically-inducible protein OsmY
LLQVDVQEGTVTLRGRVASFYEKQVAIHSCQRVAGVHKLIDAVDVSRG